MGLNEVLLQHRKKIIWVGLITGGLSALNKEILPQFLDQNTYLVYLGIIGVAAYTFATVYNNEYSPARTVAARDLRNPSFRQEVARQAGININHHAVPSPAGAGGQNIGNPTRDVFEEFNKN